MNEIVRILMTRDKISEEEATEAVSVAQQLIINGEDPEDILADELGLEPDYFFDLIEDI